MQETILGEHLEASRWSPHGSGTVARALVERLMKDCITLQDAKRQMVMGKLSSGRGRVLSSSRIQAQRWRLQPLIKKSWTLDPYGGRTVHTGITVLRNALLAAPSRREDPLNIETRSGETRKLSKHHSGAKDYYSKGSLMSKKYRDKLVVCYNCGMPGHKRHRLPIESEQSCHLE